MGYIKALEVWGAQNRGVPEVNRYQDVIESLKQNKEISGLEKYMGEHVYAALDTEEEQTIASLIAMLKRRYGKTKEEEVEEVALEWINFRANEHEDDEEFLLALEKLKMKKDRLRISETEWFSMFMMIQTKKRKGVEGHQIQGLKDIVKKGGDEVIEQFREKYKEMRIESNRGKVSEAYYMGHESRSTQRFHSQQRVRKDSRGRDYFQDRKGRTDSKGREFYRRYYRRESRPQRDFSRDFRSFSRQRGRSESRRDNRNRENEGRSGSRNERSKSKEDKRYKTCIGCKCESCIKMRKNAQELTANFCEGYNMNEEMLVNYTEKGKQVMILDLGAPVSLAGKEWMNQYLKEHQLKIED